MQRGEPWFDDGNVVLATAVDPATAFRVHRGVMARHSEVFESMFLVPQPLTESVETLDGCQVVRMWDSPVELANLISALYDGVQFHVACLEDWFHLAGILRLSTKYFINRLRLQAIEYLAQTWSYTLKGHDDMVEAALNTPAVDGLTYPFIHPLHVLTLAREVNVRIVVPSAIYFLSLYELHDILRADHPKLTKIEHPARPSSVLAPNDIKDYTLMFQKRLDIIFDFVRTVCGKHQLIAACQSPEACTGGFQRLTSRLNHSWIARTGPLHYMSQAVADLTGRGKLGVCKPCLQAFTQEVAVLRERTWNELPSVVGLPPWEDLVSMDLHGG
ncbi:hypothetical protein C8F01DRAFT_1113467 [Mycena amicta]|nr:hypothetical protein C8F01DRAFT_1113467 [Mycena amicta]